MKSGIVFFMSFPFLTRSLTPFFAGKQAAVPVPPHFRADPHIELYTIGIYCTVWKNNDCSQKLERDWRRFFNFLVR